MIQTCKIAFAESKALPGIIANQGSHLRQIVAVAGGEIIETNHGLAVAQQKFDKIRADKSSRARHQPAAGQSLQFDHGLLESGHDGDLRLRGGFDPAGFGADNDAFPGGNLMAGKATVSIQSN